MTSQIMRVIYAVSMVTILLFPASYMSTSTDMAIAKAENVLVVGEEEKIAYVEDVPLLDDEQWSELEAIVLSNDNVKAIMQDKEHSLYSQGFVRYLSDDKPEHVKQYYWYPNIVYIYYEDSEKYLLSALVDYEEKKVVDVLLVKHPSQELRSSLPDSESEFNTASHSRRSFSIAYYTGSATNIYLFRITAKAPSSYSGQISTHENLAFLLNATAANSLISDLCNSSNTTGSYWAQVGMAWSLNLKEIVWTDTREGCGHRYYSRAVNGDGNNYFFSIHTSGSGSTYTWYICAINTTARIQECQQRSNISKGTFLTNNLNSSIWLENNIVGTDWYRYFGSNIQAGNAKYKKVGDSTTYNWDAALLRDKKCTGEISPSIVISGHVINGRMATWNLEKMATNYPAC